MISDDEDSKSKKEPKKSFATDLLNVYQIEVVPKSSGKDLSHNKQHMCTINKSLVPAIPLSRHDGLGFLPFACGSVARKSIKSVSG